MQMICKIKERKVFSEAMAPKHQMNGAIEKLLEQHGLHNTQPRRLVLEALRTLKKPESPLGIQEWIRKKKKGSVNAVTIYRIIEALETADLVHRHPCNGLITFCSLPGKTGHHGFLHCTSCGTSREYCDESLCALEDRIAKKAGFAPTAHVSEILGLCAACQS